MLQMEWHEVESHHGIFQERLFSAGSNQYEGLNIPQYT